MLTCEDKIFGIQECELDLAALYPTPAARRAFHARFETFLHSDATHPQLFSLHADKLSYCTEVFVSPNRDDRPPLLLLLGNPASHSVAAGMCFSFEKDGLEHRFWKLLAATGLLAFAEQAPPSAGPLEKNALRRRALWELNYHSPFRVGIAVFYSLPSAASDPQWSGVLGLRRLLGARTFERVSLAEEERIAALIAKGMGSTAGIIAFQKDAYERTRSADTPAYSKDLAGRGLLLGKYKMDPRIPLAGSPPTRLAHARDTQAALRRCKDWLSR